MFYSFKLLQTGMEKWFLSVNFIEFHMYQNNFSSFGGKICRKEHRFRIIDLYLYLRESKKIMEIVISWRLKQHLGKCNVLTSEQYGFWDGISTNNAIYKLITSVYEAWNNKHYIVCIVCDITKAFECMCHEGLFSKL